MVPTSSHLVLESLVIWVWHKRKKKLKRLFRSLIDRCSKVGHKRLSLK